LDFCLRQFEHTYVGVIGFIGGEVMWYSFGHIGQGTQVWRIEVDEDAEGVFGGYESSSTICLSSETLFVVESDRDLV